MPLFRRPAHVLTDDRRTYPRFKVACSAVLVTSTGNRDGTMVDISQSGASIQMAEPPAPGCSALLEWTGPSGSLHEAYGKIKWSRGKMCGLEFERYLAKSDIDQCLANDGAAPAVRTFGQKRSSVL